MKQNGDTQNAETRSRQEEIWELMAGSRAVLDGHDFQTAARSIFDACKRIIGATAGYMALLSDDGMENEVLFLDSGGTTCTVDPALPMPVRGLREKAYSSGRTVYENDFSHSEWTGYLPPGHVELGSVLFAPLMIRGIAVGLLGLANKPGGFTETDARMAAAFGEMAAVALLNSRALEALQHSDERLRAVTQTASDAIINIDGRGNIVFWNQAAEAIFGYTHAEAVGKPLALIMPERFRAGHQNGVQRVVSGGESRILGKTVEMAGLDRDGREFPVELSLSAWTINSEVFFTGIIRDISERRRAEEEIQSLARFPSENRNPVLRVSRDGTIRYANAASAPMLAAWDSQVDQKLPESWQQLIPDVIGCDKRRTIEVACGERIFALDVTPVKGADYVNLYGRDVTERRQAEKVLRDQNQFIVSAFESLAHPFYVIDANDYTIKMANSAAYQGELSEPLTCYALTHARHTPCRDAGHSCPLDEIKKTGKPVMEEHIHYDGQGQRAVHEVHGHPIFDEAGNVTQIIEYTLDVTERKRTEEALAQTTQLLEAILEHTPTLMAYLDPQFNFIRVNHAYAEADGREASFFPGRNHFDLYPHPENEAIFRRVVATGEPYHTYAKPFEYPEQPEWGVSYWDWSLVPLKDPGGAVTALVFTLANVTERVEAELALARERDFTAAVLDTAGALVVVLDPQGRIVRFNRACENLTGYTFDEVAGRPFWDLFLIPEEVAPVKAVFRKLKAGQFPDEYENYWVAKDGGRRLIAWSNNALLDAAGSVEYVIGTGIDVTERTQAEEALRESEHRHRNLFEQTLIGVVSSGTDGRITAANPALVELLGYSDREELLGQPAEQIWFSADDRFQALQVARDRGYLPVQEVTLRRKDGAPVYALATATIDQGANDDVHDMTAMVTDITAHKRAEAALWESQERFRLAFHSANIGQCLVEPHGRFMLVNHAMCTMFGYSKDELEAMTVNDVTHPDYLDVSPTFIQRATSGEITHSEFEKQYVHKQGHIIWGRVSSALVRDVAGTPMYFISLVEDITERKRTQQALREAHDQLELRVQQRTAELENANQDLRAEIAHRQRVEAQLRQQSAVAESLVQATLALNSSLDLDRVLDRILEQTQHVIPCCAATVMLVSEETVTVSRHRGFDAYPESWEALQADLPLETFSALQSISATQRPVLVADTSNEPEWRYAPGFEWVRSYVAVPVRAEKTIIGFLAVFSEQPGLFSPEIMDLLEAFAAHAVAAILNAERYAAEMQARLTAETLSAASLALTQTLDLDTVINTLLDYLRTLVPYDSACVLLPQDETHLVVRVARDYERWADTPEVVGTIIDSRERPFIQALLTTQQSVLIPDTRQEPEWGHCARWEHALNWLGVPLVADGRVIGICGLDKTETRFFTQQHRQLAEALIGQATLSIQNAWLFEQVRAGRERLQSLSRRLVEVQESERRYIARELHDDAGQALTSLKVGLRLLEREAGHPEAVVAGVSTLMHMADGVLENLHRLAVNLRPATLDHLGLVAALHQYAEAISDQHGLVVQFEAVGAIERLPSEVETALYRAVQEALTNVVRHAQATRVDLLLKRRGEELVVLVEDNGVGFDPTAEMPDGRLGLIGLRERAEMLGGKLTVESAADAGTTLLLEVPYVDAHTHRRRSRRATGRPARPPELRT